MDWIIQRIRKNKNTIIVINGPTGSGKSYAGLRLGVEIAKIFGTPFTIAGNVDFNFGKLLKKMYLPGNAKSGTVFMMEEVGAVGGGASSREWQSKANRFFFSFLQTSRHRNQILIMNCPNFSYLDKGCRELVHMVCIMRSINPRAKTSEFTPYASQVNTKTGKIYLKKLRWYENYMKYRLDVVQVTLPPKDMVDRYEKVKLAYTDALNKSIMDECTPDAPDMRRGSKVDPELVVKLTDKGLKNKDIAELFDVSIKTIQRARSDIKKELKVTSETEIPRENVV